jgi:hypothetical protein
MEREIKLVAENPKTSDETLDSIRQHIMSFPIMDSHNKRKDTNRKVWQQDLSITKMYDLYCYFFSFSEYALQYSQESFLGLWNEKLNSLQKTLLYVMDEAGIISSAVHFAL